jgi:uncharacterized RDD family membrane protein YckC
MEPVAIYPRFLRRVRALLIDWAITVFVLTTWWLSIPLIDGHSVVTKFAYPIIAWFVLDPMFVWRLGGTPGQYFMKLRIQDKESGKHIGLPRAIIRSLLKILTGTWSFVLVFMTKRHQALHDVLTSTTVILRNPELLPSREQIHERALDVGTYNYPTALRRVLVMFSYIVLATVVLAVLLDLTLPETCILYEQCKTTETLVLNGLSGIWWFGIIAILISGWRSRLYGARRKPLSNTDNHAP